MNYELGNLEIDLQKLQRFMESNALLYCVIFLLTFKIIIVAFSVNLPFNVFFADITKSALEAMANQTRQSVGLSTLKENPKLVQAARLKAEDMIKNEYFSHTSPTGVTPWYWFLRTGYNYKYAGENLAIGFFESTEVYNAWLNSPSHKANLINPDYKEMGTAVATGYGSNKAIVVVQLFGSEKTIITAQPAKTIKTVKQEDNPPAPVAKTPADAKEAKVLSQSIEAKIEPDLGLQAANPIYKTIGYLVYNYGKILDSVIFGASMVFICLLLALIFFSFNFNVEKKLVFRSIAILFLLGASAAIDKDVIISLIPHQLLIQ